MVDTAIVDTATAVHHTATVDEPWDGPAAMAAMPNSAATLRYCCAWVDPEGDPDAKGSYKFPHHKSKGGPANLAGCRNGLARLSGSKIPDGDKPGVKRHLQAHIDDASPKDFAAILEAGRTLRMARPQAALRQGARDWYRIEASAAGAEVYLFDEIGYFGVSAADFVTAFKALGQVPVALHINSPGGEVFDGVAIYNAIKQHPMPVTVYIDGLAASAASFIAQAGDRVVMAKHSTMMIHDALGLCIGNAEDMTTTAALLDKISGTIASIYADKAGGTPDQWRDVMRGEAWYTADEAVTAGLADEVAEPPTKGTVPLNTWDLSIFNYAGRDAAPAPSTQPVPPTQPPPPPPPPFDAAAMVAALRKARA